MLLLKRIICWLQYVYRWIKVIWCEGKTNFIEIIYWITSKQNFCNIPSEGKCPTNLRCNLSLIKRSESLKSQTIVKLCWSFYYLLCVQEFFNQCFRHFRIAYNYIMFLKGILILKKCFQGKLKNWLKNLRSTLYTKWFIECLRSISYIHWKDWTQGK